MKKDQCIVVPVDGSETSIQAMDTALELAQATGAKINFLHCAYFDSSTDDDADSWLPESPVTEVVGDIMEDVRRVVKERLPNDINAAFAERIGDPATVIAEFAEQENAGLIVIGARGLSPVEGFLLGSVSQEVMETARCAVLIIKQKRQEEAFS